MTVAGVSLDLDRAAAEDFLYTEAAILDRWDLDAWLALFDERSEYQVPATDLPSGDVNLHQYLIADDYELIRARVDRLKSKYAHAENPRSRTTRLITNVIVGEAVEDTVRVHANFLIYRERDGYTDPYVGRYDHLLTQAGSGDLVFRRRKSILTYQTIRPSGRLSFIL